MDADHVILAQTGHAQLGHTTDDTLGHVENGRSGFDGVEKPPYDPTFYDDDGKPRRKGNLSLSLQFLPSSSRSGALNHFNHVNHGRKRHLQVNLR